MPRTRFTGPAVAGATTRQPPIRIPYAVRPEGDGRIFDPLPGPRKETEPRDHISRRLLDSGTRVYVYDGNGLDWTDGFRSHLLRTSLSPADYETLIRKAQEASEDYWLRRGDPWYRAWYHADVALAQALLSGEVPALFPRSFLLFPVLHMPRPGTGVCWNESFAVDPRAQQAPGKSGDPMRDPVRSERVSTPAKDAGPPSQDPSNNDRVVLPAHDRSTTVVAPGKGDGGRVELSGEERESTWWKRLAAWVDTMRGRRPVRRQPHPEANVGPSPEAAPVSESSPPSPDVASAEAVSPFRQVVETVARQLNKDVGAVLHEAARNLTYIRFVDPSRSAGIAAGLLQGTQLLEDERAVRDGLLVLRLLGFTWNEIDEVLPEAKFFYDSHSRGLQPGRLPPPAVTFGYRWLGAVHRLPEYRAAFDHAMLTQRPFRLLDIMGGEGTAALDILRNGGREGVEITVLEINPENLRAANEHALAEARQQLHITPQRLRLVPHDMFDPLPFSPQSFDGAMITSYATFALNEAQLRDVFGKMLTTVRIGGRIWIDYRLSENILQGFIEGELSLLEALAHERGLRLRRVFSDDRLQAYAYEVEAVESPER